jgi:thiosulfate/3-mercaptopyruvate sulfurtransferase
VGTLIEAEELSGRLEERVIRVFDCRFDLAQPDAGRGAYAAGHIPGAVYADLNRDLSAPQTPRSGRHPLPAPAAFEARLRAFGVNRDSVVVAYDAGNGMYASRLWWMLRWLGHEAVFVLHGGLRRWVELGMPVETSVPQPGPGNFIARPRPDMQVDAAGVLARAADPAWRLLDARAPERYRGDVEPIDAVAGHVPGAVNHPFARSLGGDDRLLPRDELRAAFARTLDGVPAGRAIAMCGSGVTACHLLLAMEHAGLAGARLYPGSWSEWSRDPSRPVARGAEP